MGVSISAVAVLEIHMEISPAASTKPPIRAEGRVPTRAAMFSAMRACRLHRSIATAIMKPAMNRNRIGSA
jgi:hypothetical protein